MNEFPSAARQRIWPFIPASHGRQSPTQRVRARPLSLLVLAAVTVGLTVDADFALAIEKRSSVSTSCDAAAKIIERDGAMILRYPSERVQGLVLYNKFVRSSSQCDGGQATVTSAVRTADSNECNLLICRQQSGMNR